MSTARSQKSSNNLQESTENESEGLVSPVVVENWGFLDQDMSVAGPFSAKFHRIQNYALERLRASLREEITQRTKRF